MVSKFWGFFIVFLSWFPCWSHSARVYGFPSMNFVSHSRVFWRVGQELAKRGHTYIHVLPDIATDTDLPGVEVRTFQASVPAKRVENMMEYFADFLNDGNFSAFNIFWGEVTELQRSFAEDVFTDINLMKDINSTADLILCDGLSNPTCIILADLLNITRVDLLPLGFAPTLNYFYGQPQALLHSMDINAVSYSGSLSFLSRVMNVVGHLAIYILSTEILSPRDVWEEYAKDTSKFDNYQKVCQAAELVLIQSDFAVTFPRPLHAHIKAIGAVLPEPPKPLPEQFALWVKEPFLLVSLGSVLSASSFKLAEILADGLAEVPLKVLWKHSGQVPLNVGPNTKVVTWLPQNDLLGHPNAKVFLTHAGLNSLSESLYHAVPMIALPLFGDQFNNAGIIPHKDIGVVLIKKELKANHVTDAVNEVIQNSKYKENILKISRIMKDRRITPTEEGADWIEHVLRHNGAAHLRSPVLDLPFYQEYMLDVFLFLSSVVSLVCIFMVFILFKLLQLVYGKVVRRFKDVTEKVKKS